MNSSPNIDVGIMKAAEIEFALKGNFSEVNSGNHNFNSAKAFIQDGKLLVETGGERLQAENEILFEVSSLRDDSFELKDVVIGIDFHWEQRENQRFRGNLKLLRAGSEIEVINIVPLEEYLVSVISSEMSADSSLQLLKAHTIISRSWLMAQIEKQKDLVENETDYSLVTETADEYIRWYDREDHTTFHVCADDHCQRYQGITRAHNPNVLKAVNETNGRVLYFGGKIADARFSKSCGGVTELFENCWEPVKHPYLTKQIDNPVAPVGFEMDLTLERNAEAFIKGNPEAFCNTRDEKVLSQVLNHYDLSANDFFRWEITYSQAEISRLIQKKSGKSFGKILNLIPVQRGESGRLVKLKIVGEKLSLTIGKELEIRRWLSESHLYSSAIVIEKSGYGKVPDKFHIRGAGWGHGVGLCQIGAAVMGEKGYSYEEILSHYFKNTELKKAY